MALVRKLGGLKLSLPQTVPSRTSNTNSVSASDLEKISVLGRGNGGTVYKVSHKITSEIYALKRVNANMGSNSREIEILRLVDSPYVVKCHEIYVEPSGEVSVLMEYMDLGTLECLRGNVVSEDQLALIARQVLKGLEYLHGLEIVHRDIKPENLLRNSKEEVKIADFGVSEIKVESLDKCNMGGTWDYMSPERLDSEAADYSEEDKSNVYAGDIWSFGLTMLEILVGYNPMLPRDQEPDWAMLMCLVCYEEPPKAPEGCSDELKSFIDCCLRKKPSERSTASELLSHPFLLRQY